MYRCSVCLTDTDFKCVCDFPFCPKCAKDESHDSTTKWCWHCKKDICKSFMENYPNEKVCFDCGTILQKKEILEKLVSMNPLNNS